MPEAVRQYALNKDLTESREIQKEILTSYTLDFAKHAPASDIAKLSLIWESIPTHLSRENKRFVFSAIRPSARAREFDQALLWLEDAGLITRAFPVETARQPLTPHADRSSYKVYALDVGLLGALARIPLESTVTHQPMLHDYQGAFVENYVAQELVMDHEPSLFYWRSRSGQAEVDFLRELEGSILPLEVKAGMNIRSRSLRVYADAYQPPLLVRTSLRNLKKDEKMLNIPLYMISQFSRLVRLSLDVS